MIYWRIYIFAQYIYVPNFTLRDKVEWDWKNAFSDESVFFMIMYIYHSDAARSLPLNRGEPKDSVARKKEPDPVSGWKLLSIDISQRDENRSRYFEKRRSSYKNFRTSFYGTWDSYEDRADGIGTILERSLISSRFCNLKLLQHTAFFMDARVLLLDFNPPPADWDNVFFSILCCSTIVRNWNTGCGTIGMRFLLCRFITLTEITMREVSWYKFDNNERTNNIRVDKKYIANSIYCVCLNRNNNLNKIERNVLWTRTTYELYREEDTK